MRLSTYIPDPDRERPLFDVMFRSALHGSRNGLIGGLVVGTFMAWMFWDQRAKPAYALWFLALLMAVGMRFWLLRAWARLPDAGIGRRHAHITAALYLVVGAIWGLAGWVFDAGAADWARFALLTTQYTLLVTSVIALSWYLPAYLAFATPLCLLIPFPWMAHSSGVGLIVAVGTLFNYCVWLSFAAHNARTQAESIKMRFERQELVAQLALRADEMEQAHQAKTRFLASASHDLRQPLHAMALVLANARQKAEGLRPGSLKSLEAMVRSLDDILESLIEAARVEGSHPELALQPCDAQAVVDQAIDDLAPLAESSQLSLRVRRQSALVMSQPGALLRIVRNLVSNALKYTSSGGVLVAFRTRGSEVWLEVWDTGEGIAREDIDHIFRPFERLPSRQVAGAGLGLAVVRQLCDSLGCRIEVCSRPGRGSVFRVSLGLKLPPEQPAYMTREAVGGGAASRVLLLVRDRELVLQLTSLLRHWEVDWQLWPDSAAWEDAVRKEHACLLLVEAEASDPTTKERLRAAVGRLGRPCVWLGGLPPPATESVGKSFEAHVTLPVQPVALRAALNWLARRAQTGAASPQSPESAS